MVRFKLGKITARSFGRLLCLQAIVLQIGCAEPITTKDPDEAWMKCFQMCKGNVNEFDMKEANVCICEVK